MIKKIICPVDFSEAATNAAEYAAKLAQILHAEVLLINIERIIPAAVAVSLGEGIGADSRENSRIASKRLREMSDDVNKMFKISSSYEVDITTQSLSTVLSAAGNERSMIVMGTNGIDNLSQFLFGTNTYNVIRKAECPVLLVPEKFSYGTYKNLLYAFTYEEKGRLALNQFYEFAKHFKAKITFLHISKKDTNISRDIFRASKEEIEKCFNGKEDLDFKRVFSDDVAEAIDQFMVEHQADMLVMAAHHRNLIEALFTKAPLMAGLSVTAYYPILVFHT